MTIDVNNKIQMLIGEMQAHSVDAYVQPTHDCFLSEYPPESAKRLAWLTGFDGSAGAVLVLKAPVEGKHAALFTDGRYTLQAAQQLDAALFHVVDVSQQSPAAWLAQHQPNAVLGFDAWIHGHQQVQAWQGVACKAVPNLVDVIWRDQPAHPCEPIKHHPLRYSGEEAAAKRTRICTMLAPQADAVFLSLPDGINWLLNMRGSDIAFNPLVLCYALLKRDGSLTLITQPRTLPKQLSDVTLIDVEQFWQAPEQLFEGLGVVQMDAGNVVHAVWQAAMAAGASVIDAPDPTLLPKATKNSTEIEGMRRAHKRDGKALSAFLSWVKQQESLDELQAVARLEAFRKDHATDEPYLGASFDTISGSGPNGAIVHYRVTKQSNRTLADGELYLVDSGGQYPDGTTDVTRTLVKGTPSTQMLDRYTRVLKGHIAIASAVFPQGTSGSQLDALARQYLWQIGEDYAHGTGHGVGSFLCVHEGPQRISKRGGDVALQAGMILSNEPGFYQNGEYGIRIENLVLVKPAPQAGFLCFEDLTLAPLEEALIDKSMLTPSELAWLAHYQKRVEANIAI